MKFRSLSYSNATSKGARAGATLLALGLAHCTAAGAGVGGSDATGRSATSSSATTGTGPSTTASSTSVTTSGTASSSSSTGTGGGKAPWTLDSSYGNGGVIDGFAMTSFAQASDVHAIVPKTDGSAYYVGDKTGSGFQDFLAIHVEPQGGLGSERTDDIASYADTANAAVLYPDGRLLVAGTANNGLVDRFGLIRYKANGTPDLTFDQDGKVLTASGFYNQAYAAALDGSRVIVAGGAEIYVGDVDFEIAVYGDDGALDTTFDSDGIATASMGANDIAYAIAVQPDHRILVAGDVDDGISSQIGVARFNANGTLDLGFGNAGKVVFSVGDSAHIAPGAAILQPDGKLVLAGTATTGNNSDYFAARLNADGSLDASFSADGKVTVDHALTDSARGLFLTSQGDFVILGSDSGKDFSITRLSTSGQVENEIHVPFTGEASALSAVETPGHIIVFGDEVTNYIVHPVSVALFE